MHANFFGKEKERCEERDHTVQIMFFNYFANNIEDKIYRGNR